MSWTIGVIGGSGLYAIDALEDAAWVEAASPWGEPSDALRTGTIGGVRFVFLPRHGRGHRIAPGALNARANIDVLKRAGCTDLVSVSAVGSLCEAMAPGDFVIVDQFIDRTTGRPASFFGTGMVAHVSMADPACPRLRRLRRTRRGRRGQMCMKARPIWRWKGRSSRRAPNRTCIANGART